MQDKTPCPYCENGVTDYDGSGMNQGKAYGPCPRCGGTGFLPTLDDFIQEEGIGMLAEKFATRPDLAMDGLKRHFKCTLHAGKATRWDGGADSAWEREMVVWFSQGDAHKLPPTTADVLDCLASDASGYDNSRNFEDWCADYGYDDDSRKAEKIYHTVAEDAKRLRHFLGNEAYNQLLNEVERL